MLHAVPKGHKLISKMIPNTKCANGYNLINNSTLCIYINFLNKKYPKLPLVTSFGTKF